MEKQIYCCNICTMWAGGTTVGTAGGLTQTLIICTVMHVVAQRLRSRSMTEVGYLAGKADVWSCAIPPSASGESSHRARAESAGPLGSPRTEMALRRDRTWKGRIIWSSKLVYSISANNLACDLQNRSTHQIRNLHPSFGKQEDAMMQKNARSPVFIHTPGSREPDHTLSSTSSCLPGQKHVYAFETAPQTSHQC